MHFSSSSSTSFSFSFAADAVLGAQRGAVQWGSKDSTWDFLGRQYRNLGVAWGAQRSAVIFGSHRIAPIVRGHLGRRYRNLGAAWGAQRSAVLRGPIETSGHILGRQYRNLGAAWEVQRSAVLRGPTVTSGDSMTYSMKVYGIFNEILCNILRNSMRNPLKFYDTFYEIL